jgi:ATP phosphoribosyltransferase
VLRIALPNKGRLSEDARDLLGDAGLDLRIHDPRALRATVGGEFEAIFVRTQDIPEFVADGVADIGVTGWDLIQESGRNLVSRLDLGFGACRLVVAVKQDSAVANVTDLQDGTRVATAFPAIARRFFAERERNIELVPVCGATEIAPHLGIADVVVDLTSTGSTLKTNGLREIDTILQSTAHLVTLPSIEDESRCEAISTLVDACASVLRARDKRYLMANVPRSRLPEVREVLPGLNGPTVVDILADPSQVAVHAVVPVKSVYRTIAQLKRLGAEGILLTRIERLTP